MNGRYESMTFESLQLSRLLDAFQSFVNLSTCKEVRGTMKIWSKLLFALQLDWAGWAWYEIWVQPWVSLWISKVVSPPHFFLDDKSRKAGDAKVLNTLKELKRYVNQRACPATLSESLNRLHTIHTQLTCSSVEVLTSWKRWVVAHTNWKLDKVYLSSELLHMLELTYPRW